MLKSACKEVTAQHSRPVVCIPPSLMSGMKRYAHNMKRKLSLVLIVTLGLIGCSDSGMKPVVSGQLGVEEAVAIATDTYIYGYPLVTMDLTRKQMTNVATPDDSHAPMGQLLNLRTFPPLGMQTVTASNADMLYTTGWVDVSKEPWIFSIPDMGDRYYLMPILDGWTNVFQVPGKRTTGGQVQKYAITGPAWSGTLPAGVTEYRSPTGMVWILGRIYCAGTPDDYKAVHALQDEFSLAPLSSYGKSYTPLSDEVDINFDMKTAIRGQVDTMDVITYFSHLARLMKTNPPAAEDAPMVAKMARIGLVPGQDFDPGKLLAFGNEATEGVPQRAQLKIHREYFKRAASPINGWIFFAKTGLYGTDYLDRAFLAAAGLGVNRPQDAIYLTAQKDESSKDFDGSSKKYVMHFDKGQMPPVNGFWSLTMYNAAYFFVPNTLNRYTLDQRDKFVTNADGSVDLYLQTDSPGKAKEANWLPVPKDKFVPMLRLYWPKETPPSILDSTWNPPAIRDAQ